MLTKIIAVLKRFFFPSAQDIRVRPWFKNNGDRTLRLFYDDLNANSVVIDLGGYEGQWASDIYSINNCNVFVFEPYKVYAENIKRRFIKNNKIQVFDFGLGNSNKTEYLSIINDSSSTLRTKDNVDVVSIDIKEIKSFLESANIEKIDLMKINIEGAEYDLLEYIIEKGLISKIFNIQVQFHDFVPNALERMTKIQTSLRKTHDLTYQYTFVWENWRIKN